MSDRDTETAKNILRRVSHRPKEEKEAILREWFGKKASPEFIRAAMAKTESTP